MMHAGRFFKGSEGNDTHTRARIFLVRIKKEVFGDERGSETNR